MTTSSSFRLPRFRLSDPKALIAALVASTLLIACTDRAGDTSTDPAATHSAEPVSMSASSLLTVTDSDGAPLGGAHVSIDLDDGRRITRFTNSSGQLDLNELPASDAGLSLRYPGKLPQSVSRETLDGPVALVDDDDFRRHLPSNHWLELLPDDDARKREFTVNCGTCHEVGHDRVTIDGKPRTKDQWLAAIAMMRAMDAYEVIPPDFDDNTYASWLAEQFTTAAIATLAPRSPTDVEQLSRIEITEYALPESGSLPHDLVNGPDGRIWITGFFYDELWALSPDTGAIERSRWIPGPM